MKTLVELWIDKEVSLKMIKEVIELTKSNTPNPEGIQVRGDELDDNLVIIKFESINGKQVDLAEQIMRSYSHFLNSYRDISIFFETKRKKISVIEENWPIKGEVIRLVKDFMESLDRQDWEQMSKLLDERIEVIVPESEGRLNKSIRSSKYLSDRQQKLANRIVKHKIIKFKTCRRGEIRCHCNFEMIENDQASSKKYRSEGTIDFIIRSIKGGLKIKGIKQRTDKNYGKVEEYLEYLN